jgi:hypothetical protein
VFITNPLDQEVFTFQAVAPDGTIWGQNTLTYSASTQCFTWGGRTSDYAFSGGGCNGSTNAWSGPTLPCTLDSTIQDISNGDPLVGTWTLQLFDSAQPGNPVITHTFNLQHNSSSQLGIISPTDNQLIDLAQDKNFTATDQTCPAPTDGAGNATAACFSAGTSSSNPINWSATLSYNTSAGYGYYTDTLPSFPTSNGQVQNEQYQATGGRVNVTAQNIASDGSTVYDCSQFYVEGTNSIDPTINLLNLYSTGATPHLMTGVAQHESTYKQFFTQTLLGATAYWPHESADGGSHIGLMMVPTQQPYAWDWTSNTNDGVNDASYGFVVAKLPLASTWQAWITNGHGSIPGHSSLATLTATQLEDMALVLYGPAASGTWTKQFYIPVCPSGNITNHSNIWTCNNASWYWAVNDPAVDSNVTASNIGPGVTVFGNHPGVAYVDNTILFTDESYEAGVRAQMH